MASNKDKTATQAAATNAKQTPADIVSPGKGKAKAKRVSHPKVYRVLNEKSKQVIFVKAATKGRALSYSAQSVFKVAVATADELLAAGRDALEVHDATTEETEDE